MSQKVGRPKASADAKKDIRFSIRLDVKTNKALQEYCKRNSVTKGEAIRQGINLLLGK